MFKKCQTFIKRSVSLHKTFNNLSHSRCYSTSASLTNKVPKFKLYQKEFKLPETSVLSEFLMEGIVEKFWNIVYEKINIKYPESHLALLIKLHFAGDLHFRTMLELKHVNITDKQKFLEDVLIKLDNFQKQYLIEHLISVTFMYTVRPGLATTYLEEYDKNRIGEKSYRFNNTILPISTEPTALGEIISVKNNIKHMPDTTHYIVRDIKGKTYDIYKNNISNVSIVSSPGGVTYRDTVISQNIFKREISGNTFYFDINKKDYIVKEKVLPAKPFTKSLPHKKLINNSRVMAIDIETVLIDGSHKPYLICGYSNGKYIHSFCKDVNDTLCISEMFEDFIKQIITFKKVSYIYAHNFSGFDGIFLFKYLLHFKGSVVDPVIFKDKLIAIKFIVENTTRTGKISKKSYMFKDSFLLLPNSLRDLCKAFSVDNPKTYFPFRISDINYRTSSFPDFDLFENISRDTYDTLVSNFINSKKSYWDFKEEALKYCKLDCLALSEVLDFFNTISYNDFKINPHKSLTISGYASKIFSSKYLEEGTLYQITGLPEVHMREAFSGGAVDNYIPHNAREGKLIPNYPHRSQRRVQIESINNQRIAFKLSSFRKGEKVLTKYEKLFYYDVNSLYPFVMANTPMPIGKPIYFEGDKRTVIPDAYGVFYCEIESPDDLLHPILQRRVKTVDGIRTIAGLGKWSEWITSVEIDKCLELGYKFNILKGYRFAKKVIYKEFVTDLYKIRQQYPKSDPRNLIAKLIMNSVYGRLGMKSQQPTNSVFDISKESDKNKLIEIIDSNNVTYINKVRGALNLKSYSITGITPVDKQILIVEFSTIYDMANEDTYSVIGSNVNVAAAAMISAGARVHMAKFKNNPNMRLYYSDTDSIIVNKQLDSQYVSKKLGNLKLENIITQAVFLAPKVYALLCIDEVTQKENLIIKIKGLSQKTIQSEIKSNNLSFDTMFSLLSLKASAEFTQEKWFKNYKEGNIGVKQATYHLVATTNKRKPIYNYVKNLYHPLFSDTVPYHYDELPEHKSSALTKNIEYGELLLEYLKNASSEGKLVSLVD